MQPEPMKPPIEYSYWVIPGEFAAGEHFGWLPEPKMLIAVQNLLDAGVRTFVDLTEAYEASSYVTLAQEEGLRRGVEVNCYQFPIRDMSTPTPELMHSILDTIDANLQADRGVYLHCLAGLGRTGTVVGCWMVRHGLSGERALKEIVRLRGDMLNVEMRSPQRPAQVQMVLDWKNGS